MKKIFRVLRYVYFYIHRVVFKLAYKIIASTPAKEKSEFGLFSYERTAVYKWLKTLKDTNKISGITLDIGCGPSDFSKKLFSSETKEFLNVDLYQYETVDIVCSIYELDKKIEENYADNILCCDVLEHIENTELAIKQMHKVLKKEGTLYISVPFGYRIHASEEVKDFYRFTADGLKYLLKDFNEVSITYEGPKELPYCYLVEAKK